MDITARRRKETFYLTMTSTHFSYVYDGYVALSIWIGTIQIKRKETCFSFWLTAGDL